MQTRIDALSTLQKAIREHGLESVAKKLAKHIDTVKRWRDGENLPAGPVAARILYIYAGSVVRKVSAFTERHAPQTCRPPKTARVRHDDDWEAA